MSTRARWSVVRSVHDDPFTLSETFPGHYSLVLSEFSPADEVFAQAKRKGGGYGWELVARRVVEDLMLAGRIDFDPEADIFCAYADDREALELLGAELARLFNDADKLRRVLARLPSGMWGQERR